MLNVRKLYGETTIDGQDLESGKRNYKIHLKYYKTRNAKKYGIKKKEKELVE